MVLDQEMLSVKSFFETRGIPLSDFWLESCIKWYRDQNSAQNHLESQLRNIVYEQWLLLDLREVELPSLPPSLKDHKKLIFNGNYCLQLMYVLDIAKPKHWQLSKIRNANILTNSIENDKDVTDSKRMLQVTLTDGVQEVDAIEYQPIPTLNLNLTPGIKMRLVGPITVRRGKIMLEAQNVKVLGGEVEELLVSNATENVLARELGLPENPNPATINTETVNCTIDEPLSSKTFCGNNNPTRNNAISSANDDIRRSLSTRNTQSLDDIDEEEEIRIAQEVEMLFNAEHAVVPGPSRLRKQRTPDMFEDDFQTCDLENIDRIEKVAGTSRNPITSTQKTVVTVNLLDNTGESEDDIFRDVDIDFHLDKIDKGLEGQPISIRSLLEKTRTGNGGIFKVKAKFKTVVEKLTVTNQAWSFKIEIEDESGTVVADVHTDVITKLAECGPSVIMDLKSKISNADNSAELMIRNVWYKLDFL